MKKRAVVSLERVGKNYSMGVHVVKALAGVSLEIFEGEFVAVTGPSGSGKSTMMNLIGCLDYPSSGVVRLDGQDIASLDDSELAKVRGRKIGFVFQKFNLIPYLTAVENVALPLVFRSMGVEERVARGRRVLERVGLGHRLGHKPNELSGGEQQRVAIARALAGEPQLLLADEPTGNLDSKTGAGILALLKELNEEGKTVVMVSHEQALVEAADRVVRLKDGVLAN